jgi:hypothetical protein
MNPKCDSVEFSLTTTVSLTSIEAASFWVSCDVCDSSGPIRNNVEEAKEFFEEETDDKQVAPGVLIRDEIDDCESKPNELLTTMTTGKSWDEQSITAETIMDDLKRAYEKIRLERKSEPIHDLRFDANGNPVMVFGPPRPWLAYPGFEGKGAFGLPPLWRTFFDPSTGEPFNMKENVEIEAIIDCEFDDKHPHTCDCGSKCYNDGFKIECTNSACNFYSDDT